MLEELWFTVYYPFSGSKKLPENSEKTTLNEIIVADSEFLRLRFLSYYCSQFFEIVETRTHLKKRGSN